MRIVFATGNAGKIREIRDILADVDAEILSLKDLGLSSEAEENGSSFGENARIKIMEIYDILNKRSDMKDTVIMADDSGLCIDCLGGEPGVHSARYMGHDTSYVIKNRAILDRLRDVPEEERGAGFVCHISAIDENGRIFDAEGEMRGRIAHESRGSEGFGYDPIFYLPELGRTSGELSEEEKNAISHRGKVLRMMKDILSGEGIISFRQ
ncbi:MAG: RdgB/HAM1 family non-canonical purine NTP pyrophosphatase [Clostridiales bacterium]|nr:RdgB/HAM1 family non-canonical purine NTP pyrophosphatase [Clostridiales bacterium]MDO5140298.1 RdgB/HAM1 family non-canonical purine NTP pyrophosphatase [Eubacteriales bacterium]